MWCRLAHTRWPLRSPVALSAAGKAAEAASLVLLVTLVPRLLGPSDYGVFALAVAVVTIGSSSLSFGGLALLSRFVPAVAPADRASLALVLAERLARPRAAVLLAAIALGGVLAVVAPDQFPPVLTALVLLALVLDVAATLVFQVALGLGRAGAFSFRYAAQNMLLVVATIPLYRAAGATGAVAGVVVASAGALALGVAATAKHRLRAPRADIPPGALRFARLQSIAGILTQLTHRGGVLVVIVLASSSEAGYTALATGVALAVTYAAWQAFVVDLPRLSEAADLALAVTQAEARTLARRVLVAIVPAVLVAAVVLDETLELLAGERYAGAEAALGPALATLPLAPLTGLGRQLASLHLRPGVWAWANGAGVLAFVTTAVVAVPRWESVGGTAAFFAGTLLSALVCWGAFRSVFGLVLPTVSLAAAAAVVALSASPW